MAANFRWAISFVIFFVSFANCEDTKDLDQAEANGKLEIIKQIKKINEDGSYTIGYEADDGSFKIESRDVLGNIKGTYGYIDEDGDIKRVSYSSSNSTEVLEKTDAPSVVQRIPKILKTNNSTRKPFVVYPSHTPTSTPVSTLSVVQSIPRRRIVSPSTPPTTSTTSTEKSFEKVTKPDSTVYSTVAPTRILIQSRPLVRGANLPQSDAYKPETQQIARPDISSRTTDSPIYRNLPIRNTLLDTESTSSKPIEPEIKTNLLRRQLNPEKVPFDSRQHAYNLHQAIGNDNTDVYSGSVTTGTPRPLFTTSSRPKILSSTTVPPIRSTLRYQPYQRPQIPLRNVITIPEAQGETTTDASVESPTYASPTYSTPPYNPQPVSTPTPLPVVQIPANRGNQEPLVAVRHPFHRGTILVPANHFQLKEPIPTPDQINYQPQYINSRQQYYEQIPRPTNQHIQENSQPIFVRIPQAPLPLPPMPVHVDENGYIRHIPQQRSYSVPPRTYPSQPDVNDIDQIKPPVSTRDFQKLLEQLIIRQTRLEQVSMLSRNPELSRPRYRHVYQPVDQSRDQPIYLRKPSNANGPVQFAPVEEQHPQGHYVTLNPTNHRQILIQPRPMDAGYYQDQQYQQQNYNQRSESYVPNKRMARVIGPETFEDENQDSEYLPADVREMLLLRMLQLAINPALPLSEEEMNQVTRSIAAQKKEVRNVEIIGEEPETKNQNRVKRYKNYHEYY